jgi:hypothetical protein
MIIPFEYSNFISQIQSGRFSSRANEPTLYSRPRFGLQSTNPIASLSKYPAKAISITPSTGKSISVDRFDASQ